MRFEASKWIIALGLGGVLFTFQAPKVYAAGIPVYCFSCDQSTNAAANAILDGMRSQTEALINAMDYVMRTEQKLAVAGQVSVAATEQKINNAYHMEPSLGAKPRSACGQLGAAGIRAMAAATAPEWQKVLSARTKRHNETGRHLSQKEPRRDYNVKQVIDVLDDKTFTHYGRLITATDPINPDDKESLAKRRRMFEMLLNPFPVETPSEPDVVRIKASGSPGEKQALAESIVVQRRQEVGQSIHDEQFERDIQRIDASKLSYMVDDVVDLLDDEQAKLLKGKISPNQLDELLSTWRVKSEKWVKQVNVSPSPEMVQREQVMIQAQMLDQMWEIKQVLVKLLKVNSFSEVRQTSQNGMQIK